MKKTLLVTLDYPPMVGGIAHYYKNVVDHLPQESIHVLDNSEKKLLASSMVSRPRWLIGIWHTWRAVRKLGIEHILVGQVLPIGTVAFIQKLLFGTPYTVIVHGMDVTMPFANGGSRRKQVLMRTILANADSIIAVSNYTKEAIERIGVAENKIVVVHPCLSEEKPDLSGALSKARPHILSVGRFVERKGFDRLIEAMQSVQEEIPDARLVIAGDGEQRGELERMVHEKGLNGAVTFAGKVDDAELKNLYSSATVFAMPSRELPNGDVEGFGIVFLEAAQHGLPVIGGRSGGVPDAIEDGVTGYLVDPENPEEIAQRIIELLDDPAKAAAMGKAGQERMQKEFQWPQQVKKIEALLQ